MQPIVRGAAGVLLGALAVPGAFADGADPTPGFTLAPTLAAASVDPETLATIVELLETGPDGVAGARDTWAATVSRAADSVVSLKLSQLRAFDGAAQGASTATGFVVDAERGIVLTNRHVVSSGPLRVSATFQNQERVDAVPLYRDPVHDFAFIRYDPADLDFSTPASLVLRPDKARTGLNIRVIGSDGGEQLSILPGTIARLDRAVPSYGRYGYNDFNTFYLQAASGTSGGSSGSPVIDADGDVVALNAAANTRTASSFFLPLARVKSALARLRRGLPIERGGLQTLFSHEPFRELRRLGVDAATEAAARAGNPLVKGMLVVEQVIPGGTAADVLDVGDVLVSAAGAAITDFVALEALLDARVGERIPLRIVRQGEPLEVTATVADLHALAPRRFVELGDSVLQDMSIQDARAMNLPQAGVVLGRAGYFFERAGVPDGAVIRQVDGRAIEGLDDLLAALRAAPRDAKLGVRFVVPGDEFSKRIAQVEISNRWFGNRRCSRVDDARFWDCAPVILDRRASEKPARAVMVPSYGDALLDRVAPALVQVDFDVPYGTDNVYAKHFKGVGLVVDRLEGLVVVDRNTVPVGLGDAEITFFGSQVIGAEVVYLHPRHNVAILKYAPDALDGARFDPLELVDEAAVAGPLTMIGYRSDGTFAKHAIDELSRTTIVFPDPGLARFQQSPVDVYGVPNVPPSLGGPLVDADGRVHGLYTSFAYEADREIQQRNFAMPAYVIREALRGYRVGSPWHSLDLHLEYRPLALARELGLPDAWLARYLALDAESRRVLYVDEVVPATDAAAKLAAGDVLLAIDGELVADLFRAERLSQRPRVTLSVLRDGEVAEIEVEPGTVDTLGTQRLVSWAGATFQAPHPDIAFEKGIDFPGVYVGDTVDGSPASWDGLFRNRFVTAVDGQAIESLDDFLALVGAKAQDEITRLTTISMSGRKRIVTVAPEYHFWPTFELRRGADGWRRIERLN